MKIEYEAKSLNINKNKLSTNLKQIGAKLVFPETKFVRQTFISKELKSQNAWLRIQKEYSGIFLALKVANDKCSVSGLQEMSIEVKDFDKTCKFLEVLGYQKECFEEKLREKWSKDNIIFDIDTWPGLAPFIEIEADSENEVIKGFKHLDLEYEKAFFGPIDSLYKKELGIDITKLKKNFFA
ncbi:MAG: CYTH domain-containing protein [Patescibacteria group bacterium]|nr:CYTH domain-containing protein [Patescibacteria group bacterium]